MKVAYQGTRGSYSEAAIHKHFGKDAESIGYETSEYVFKAVKNNKADFGFLPFENTIAGSVVINYDLLLKEDVFIIAEVFLRISHALLSHKGSKLSNIRVAYSHPHALAQCMSFLQKHKIKPIPEYDTAGSAKIVAERKKKDEASIAPELCAGIYNLDVLAKDIETNKNNTTKFFVFVRKENIPQNLKKEKTSIAFKTKHRAGALVQCLQRLSKNNINLTKLESRPIPENPWEYVFYADFIGGEDDKDVKTALSEMEAVSEFVKILGSYPKGKEYK